MQRQPTHSQGADIAWLLRTTCLCAHFHEKPRGTHSSLRAYRACAARATQRENQCRTLARHATNTTPMATYSTAVKSRKGSGSFISPARQVMKVASARELARCGYGIFQRAGGSALATQKRARDMPSLPAATSVTIGTLQRSAPRAEPREARCCRTSIG